MEETGRDRHNQSFGWLQNTMGYDKFSTSCLQSDVFSIKTPQIIYLFYLGRNCAFHLPERTEKWVGRELAIFLRLLEHVLTETFLTIDVLCIEDEKLLPWI